MHSFSAITMLLFALGQSRASAPSPPSRSAFDDAVKQLSAAKYEARQHATELLWAGGENAIPALERAIVDRNPEVRSRASYVLENVRQGIAYDTPRDVLREVQRFRDGDLDDRRFALTNLENAHRPRIIFGLIRIERNSAVRQEWSQILERAIQKAILAGATQDVEVTLRDAAVDDAWMRHWVAYLAGKGELQGELARQMEEKSPASPAAHARLLAFLHRAKGDLSDARRYAEQSLQFREGMPGRPPSPPHRAAAGQIQPGANDDGLDLVWELTLEQRDWPTAARQLKEKIDREPEAVGRDPESLGFAVAYHRLAGDEVAVARYVKALRDVADESQQSLKDLDPRRQDVHKNLVDKHWFVGKALLLNGKYTEGVEVLRRHHPSFAFELLAYQQRYREAFDVAGVAYPNGFDAEWFARVTAETSKSDDAARQRFAVAMHALRQLSFLGQRTQVQEWLTVVQTGVANDPGTIRRRMLCDTAVKLGMREVALAVGAVVLEREGSPGMLSVLYPVRASSATVWWEFFREKYGSETLVQSLSRIDRLLLEQGRRFEKPEQERWLSEVEARIPQLAEPKRADWWHGLAETCLLLGEREQALRFFKKAATLSSVDTLRLGDWYAAEKKWNEAAEWYRQTSEFDKLKPLPLFLYGKMLCNAERTVEGQKWVNVALLLPLGNDEMRRELAAGLKARGYQEESATQFELLLRTGRPGEQDVIEASKQIGNAIYKKDELRGADCWETMVLCCLRNKWGFVDANGYIQIPFLVHKTRAKGLIRTGRVEEGVREVAFSRTTAPLNLELSEELVPALLQAHRPAEADQLFREQSSATRVVSGEFPNCPTLHNNLAWLFARTGRELEAALEHAHRALKLDPNNAAYVDTLAEVQFRRGQVDEAIFNAERCLQLEPRSKHYQEQLARFRAAKPSDAATKPAEKSVP